MAKQKKHPCRWCGATGIDKEHVLPAWLGRELKRQHADSVITMRHLLTGKGQPRIWDADPFSMTVREFCRPCNNGWMSRLQDEVKPHLLPLVDGSDCRLTPTAQSVLAAWGFMTTCVYDYVGRGDRVPAAHRAEFYRSQQPPSGVVVHLAPRAVDDGYPPLVQQRLRPAVVDKDLFSAYKSVIAIGHVVIQVIGFPDYSSVEGTEDMAVGATRIWPPNKELVWPGLRRRLSVEETLAYSRVEISTVSAQADGPHDCPAGTDRDNRIKKCV